MKAAHGIAVVIGPTTLSAPVVVDVTFWRLDRMEDRCESVIDRQKDHGRLDVIKDLFDRREGRADRQNAAILPRFDPLEKRIVQRTHWAD